MRKLCYVFGFMVAFIAMLSCTVMADTVVTYDTTRLSNINISVTWNAGKTAITAVRVTGVATVLDDSGNAAASVSKSASWGELPANIKTALETFGKWVGKQLDTKAVNETTEPTFPQ
jgi:hypothetical protein